MRTAHASASGNRTTRVAARRRLGEKATCRPRFGEASNVFIQVGLSAEEAFPNIIKAAHEQIPMTVTWRSYGAIDLELTDAGVAIVRFPDEFKLF